MAKWIRVSRAERCPVCDKDSYCTRTEDGTVAKCMRVESQRPATGTLGGWIHRLTEPLPVRVEKPEAPQTYEDWTNVARAMFISKRASDMRTETAKRLGVTVEALERLMVGTGWDNYRSQAFTSWPETRPGGTVVGIVRRYEDGAKLTMKGSKHGLYIPRDWWTGYGPVLVPEGGSDVAALLSLGLCAVGRPSNLGGVNMLVGLLQDSRQRRIIIIGENDFRENEKCGSCRQCLLCSPGKAGAIQTAKALSTALKRRVEWKLPGVEKDSRAWRNAGLGDGREFLRVIK